VPGTFASCEEAAGRAMELGEEHVKTLDPELGNSNMPGSGDELFIPPSASAQRTPENH
jgi:hypothetical protein